MERSKGWDASGDPDGPRILEEAAQHLVRSLNRSPSPEEQREFKDWLEQDYRHELAWAEVQRLWQGSGDLPEAKARAATKKAVSRRDIGKALIFLTAGGGAAAWYLSDHPFADYRTGTGERKRVTLPDGTRIDIAAQSRLSLDYTESERRLTLEEGEAFFQVAKDARPFVVGVGRGTVTALGTAFGVTYRDGEAAVAVTEHATRVAVGGDVERISAGFRLHYRDTALGRPERFDPETEFGWREGRLIFTNEPLGAVVSSLNRWRRGTIVIMTSALAAQRITLIVDIQRSDEILDQLTLVVPLRVVSITPLLTFLLPK
ncbi:FecR family protein [Pseudorhodoplanes sinuspersici]|uniref:Uncharacterized protein n=1 Tax=Pseudorhodoplanes sinuspersici TaxID=1235591 RepID=A0A1W6ZN34_9HYPH|nr:FecR domain-containing protein [Pseudorhodoplanes sinuspersici]ARP98550.1 hypothetical protein CAK95_05215 [Pseudorhodoplanes sinuspersici]RKE69879.1 FecR family protein [Pseudorhodoplanes sinuspersici]